MRDKFLFCLKFMNWRVMLCIIGMITLQSCRAYEITVLCSDPDIELYINEEYSGKSIARYIVPYGTETIEVTCKSEGLERYRRTFYVKGQGNRTYEVSVPENLRYSTGGAFVKSKTK